MSSRLSEKFRLTASEKQKYGHAIPPRSGGAFRPIVAIRGVRDAMDVLATRAIFVRTNGADADAKARGPGLPTLRPSTREMISRAMGAIKPGSQGERAISVKTVAQGMPDDPAEPVVPSPCFFIRTGAMGEAFTRHSLRPLLSSRAVRCSTRARFAPRECGAVSPAAV